MTTTPRNTDTVARDTDRAPLPETGAGVPELAPDYWNERYATKTFVWTVEANRFVAAEVAALTPGRALDLAAGEGRNAVWLAERGWRVRAVDFSAVALDKGRRLAESRTVDDRIEFRTADLRSYTPEPRRFDLVALVYLQIPREDLFPVLRRATEAVAPGGTFLLVGHDSTNLSRGYAGPRRPGLLYTADDVVDALAGELEIEKAGPVERPVETADGTRVAIDCLVCARRP